MKFSVATIATLATAAAAQYGAPPQGYAQQPGQYNPQQQYQQPAQYGQYQPNAQQNKYSPAEAAAWHSCVDGFLDQFNVGHDGTKTACSFWTCLEQKASQYNRGGALAAVGGAVNLVCKGSGLIPGNWF